MSEQLKITQNVYELLVEAKRERNAAEARAQKAEAVAREALKMLKEWNPVDGWPDEALASLDEPPTREYVMTSDGWQPDPDQPGYEADFSALGKPDEPTGEAEPLPPDPRLIKRMTSDGTQMVEPPTEQAPATDSPFPKPRMQQIGETLRPDSRDREALGRDCQEC